MPDHKLTVEQIIQTLGLQPLPQEGGLYRESYQSMERISGELLPDRYPDREKPYGTAIFYLLTGLPDSFSALHRLPTDEVYHFYLGDPLEITLLLPDGSSQEVILGNNLLQGEQIQFAIPGGVWQGSCVRPGGQYALIGTTMAPGFTPGDFELGQREELLAQYPQEAERIRLLTRA
jgi:uncharacterized protein